MDKIEFEQIQKEREELELMLSQLEEKLFKGIFYMIDFSANTSTKDILNNELYIIENV